jgi:hypothetical protein
MQAATISFRLVRSPACSASWTSRSIRALIGTGRLSPTQHVEPACVDLIFTDPPYPHEFIETWSELGVFAAHALKSSGLLAAYSGQFYLPEVFELLMDTLSVSLVDTLPPLRDPSFQVARLHWARDRCAALRDAAHAADNALIFGHESNGRAVVAGLPEAVLILEAGRRLGPASGEVGAASGPVEADAGFPIPDSILVQVETAHPLARHERVSCDMALLRGEGDGIECYLRIPRALILLPLSGRLALPTLRSKLAQAGNGVRRGEAPLHPPQAEVALGGDAPGRLPGRACFDDVRHEAGAHGRDRHGFGGARRGDWHEVYSTSAARGDILAALRPAHGLSRAVAGATVGPAGCDSGPPHGELCGREVGGVRPPGAGGVATRLNARTFLPWEGAWILGPAIRVKATRAEAARVRIGADRRA